jgi:general secretion pathway protein F
MAIFAYTALKKDGSKTTGELTASDRADAFRRLDRTGLQPVSLKSKDETPAAPAKNDDGKAKAAKPEKPGNVEKPGKTEVKTNGNGKAKAKAGADVPSGPVKLKKNDIVLFTEELSDLLGAGLQLEPALRIMESRDELSGVKDVTALVRSKVRDGSSFSAALRSSSSSFGDLYCNLAAAGEISGALPKILRRQAEYLVAVQNLQSKVTTAMIYPICLLVAGTGVAFLFVSYLIPQLAQLLKSMGRPLPGPALAIQAVGNFVITYWWAIAFVVGLAYWAFDKITSMPKYKAPWHERQVKLPFFGPLLSARFFVQFLETLSNLVGNGLPLLRALELTREATVNLYMKNLLTRVIAMVGEGGALSRSLKKVGFFPSLLTDMITVGEQTGDLERSLERAAVRYDKELQRTIDRGMAFVTPVIILIMAVVVGTMAYMMVSVILESVNTIKRK